MNSDFIHTYVSVDCVVFGFDNNHRLNILLVRHQPLEKQKRLPGSLILSTENADEAAKRVLMELTGIKKMLLKQFKCFSDPARASAENDMKWMTEEYKKPIDRIITVAYLSLCRIDEKINHSKYETVDWCPINEIPALPFDHNLIIKESLKEIKKWIASDFSIIFELLPKKFTIRQLHQLYNDVGNSYIDIKNFHKKIASLSYINATEELEKNVSHRAARLHQFDMKMYQKSLQKLIK